MQHQDRKCHQGRLPHQCVSLSAKKIKKRSKYRGDEIKLKAIQLIHNLKIEIAAMK